MAAAPILRTPLAGQPAQARDRRGKKPTDQPTVVSMPTRPLSEYTAAAQRKAREASYLGTMRDAVDLTRAAMTESGATSGLVQMIAHGIQGLPLQLQGDDEMRSALLDEEGAPGDYGLMMPENEAAQVFADGITTNLGLGQMIVVCWQCRSSLLADDLCLTCGARKAERPAGMRNPDRLRWWDPRWLRQDLYTRQWYLTTLSGEMPIDPGDGEFFLYQPYPEIDAWRHAPWLYITIAFVFGRDAVFDRQRHSEVLAPTRVARATKPTTKESRRDMYRKLSKMQRDNLIVLPEQYVYEIVDSTGRITDVYTAIVDWARREVEIGLTGNIVGVEGNKGFTSADVYQRVTDSKRRFYATTWFRAVRSQILTWWGADNFGTRNVPTGGYNIKSPEDVLAEAKAYEQWGSSLDTLKRGLDAHGIEADPAWVIETMQRAGVRVRLKPQGQAPARKLDLAPTDLAKAIRLSEARASQQLPPFGDSRDSLTFPEFDAMLERQKIAAEQAAAAGNPTTQAAGRSGRRRAEPPRVSP